MQTEDARAGRTHRSGRSATPARLSGLLLRETVRTRTFWLLIAATALIASTVQGRAVAHRPDADRRWLDADSGCWRPRLGRRGLLLGRVAGGQLYDKFIVRTGGPAKASKGRMNQPESHVT